MALPEGEQLWVDLDIDAWNSAGKDGRGRAPFEAGARTRWNQLAADTRQQMRDALQGHHYHDEQVRAQTASLGHEPTKEDIDGLRRYMLKLDDLIDERQNLGQSIAALRTLRSVEADTGGRVVTLLNRSETTNRAERTALIDSRTRLQAVLDGHDRRQQREHARRENARREEQQQSRKRRQEELQNVQSPGIIENDGNDSDGQRSTSVFAEELLRGQAADEERSDTESEQGESIRQAQGQLSSAWAGPASLGSGAMGTCEVFVKQNSDGIIVDRVAIKDARAGQSDKFQHHELTDMPAEVAAMYKLRPLKGSERIVKIRNWRRYPLDYQEYDYRIYTEYCGHGDLHSLVKKYWPARRLDPAEPEIPEGQRDWIPEPFLWAVFESLATAGVLMLRGDLEPPMSRMWESIVHGDLKLSNVFLGEPSRDHYRGSPQAKLGDFGVSLIIKQAHQCLPEEEEPEMADFFANAQKDMPEGEKGFGTPNARPPEQKFQVAVEEKWQPDSRANVWGVGFVLWSLIKGIDQDKTLNDFDGANTEGRKPARFIKAARNQYSYKLRRLIRNCLNWNRNQRPTFD
ncbi:hypothetical protein CLAFUW4_14459 [Fulvia fulva]|uniref:non-specific serine/threonine protein kinase n=1 Tax=Passalora fulva TaxID=5499 RepID=A0A9Q8UWG7_PASFU|nr:uncharacterized protein CLAFUR5_14291 [Fulvia fulva]UJO24983.1 hypothetical protein CLAFUR5_14291 [Fulvia fulva]WPV22594.1 hypothetical protein CLAFUW4_14459 [Fulvia fulva]